jgi:hypothetical protein
VLSLYPIYASFPLTELQRVEGISLICLRRTNAMDVLRLVLNLNSNDVEGVLAAGSPLRVTWHSDGQDDEFVGYVHSYRPQFNGWSEQIVVIAISAAYPMYTESGRTFYRVGIHNIVEEVCDDYRFQVETDPHPVMQEQVLQGSDSDWQMLVRLADEWGYTLLLDGVTLIFRPQQEVLLENYRKSEREYTKTRLSDKSGSTLMEFHPSYTAVGADPIDYSRGLGVDPVTLRTMLWQEGKQSEAMFASRPTHRNIVSELEGEAVAEAKRAKGSFPFTANAVFQAPILKKPWDVYQISHQGETKTWVVQQVKHVIHGSKYFGEMVLGSDGNNYAAWSKGDKLDVASLIRRSQRARRPRPVIIDSRPYYQGAGASVVIADQRWKAELLTVPVVEQRRSAA